MEIKYFGQYLIEKGIVSPGDLLKAMDLQGKTNLSLGDITVQAGLISPEQLEKIQQYQILHNMTFMKAARELACISPQELETIVSRQMSNNMLLGDCLVKLKILSQEQIETHFKFFRTEQSILEFKILNAIAAHSNAVLIETIIQSTVNLFRYLLDVQPRIGGFYSNGSASQVCSDYQWVALQNLSGDYMCNVELFLSKDIVLKISSSLLKRQVAEISELSLDSSKEFLNIIVGYVCSALSLKNIKCDPTVPEIQEIEQYSPSEKQIRVPFLLPQGQVEVRVKYS